MSTEKGDLHESAQVDDIPAKLVQIGEESVIGVLTKICNKIWKTEEWPPPRTHC